MAAQLSEELADVLGLKDELCFSLVPLWVEHHSIPLIEALPDHLLDLQDRRERYNILTEVFYDGDTSCEYQALVTTLFAVRYLPRLVETLLRLPAVSVMYTPWLALLESIGIRNPILASFMRTHKNRHALLAHLLKALADAVPSSQSFKEWDREAYHWFLLGRVCRGHLYNLYGDQPPRPPYPWLPSHVEILKSYLNTYQTLKGLGISGADGELKAEAVSTITFLAGALATGLAYVDYQHLYMPWTSCFGGDEKGTGCVKVKKGEEMLACGGCKTIRYCSRAHQRADWKRHKPLCMLPEWE